MGKTDVWCAICGGPFYVPSWDMPDDEDDHDQPGSQNRENQSKSGSGDDESEESDDESDWESRQFRYNPKILRTEDDRMKWLVDARIIGTRNQNYKLGQRYVLCSLLPALPTGSSYLLTTSFWLLDAGHRNLPSLSSDLRLPTTRTAKRKRKCETVAPKSIYTSSNISSYVPSVSSFSADS